MVKNFTGVVRPIWPEAKQPEGTVSNEKVAVTNLQARKWKIV